MISGKVAADEGRIRLRVKGTAGRTQVIDAVIDTGFTAALTLPPALVAMLGLRWRSLDRGILADGSVCLFDVYEAQVEWDGKFRKVLVGEAGGDALVGMRLLKGYELKMQVRARGKITI
jgi:clan AA aspartic protease